MQTSGERILRHNSRARLPRFLPAQQERPFHAGAQQHLERIVRPAGEADVVTAQAPDPILARGFMRA
eukprot:4962877-Alexandrium_andersonii.AAC.1